MNDVATRGLEGTKSDRAMNYATWHSYARNTQLDIRVGARKDRAGEVEILVHQVKQPEHRIVDALKPE